MQFAVAFRVNGKVGTRARSIDVHVVPGKFRAVLNQAYKLQLRNRSIVQYGFTVIEEVIGLKARR